MSIKSKFPQAADDITKPKSSVNTTGAQAGAANSAAAPEPAAGADILDAAIKLKKEKFGSAAPRSNNAGDPCEALREIIGEFVAALSPPLGAQIEWTPLLEGTSNSVITISSWYKPNELSHAIRQSHRFVLRLQEIDEHTVGVAVFGAKAFKRHVLSDRNAARRQTALACATPKLLKWMIYKQRVAAQPAEGIAYQPGQSVRQPLTQFFNELVEVFHQNRKTLRAIPPESLHALDAALDRLAQRRMPARALRPAVSAPEGTSAAPPPPAG